MKEETEATPEERKIMSRYFIDWLIKDVMKGMNFDDILQFTYDKRTGKPIVNNISCQGRKLSSDEIVQLYDDAIVIQSTRLWKYLHQDIKYKAFALQGKAKSDDDMYVSKVMLWWSEEARKFINKFNRG